jgi:predicted RNA-binding protein with PIN domain
MHYLIDGHNLIPKLPGLSLQSIDDELRLVELMQEYCRRSRNKVEVYFDNAPLGQAGTRRYGTVSAHFIPQGSTADDAIRLRLGKLGRTGRNWIVISSDQRVQMDARAIHAQAVPSEKFARELLAVLGESSTAEKPANAALSPEEVAAWMGVFAGRSQKPKPGR